MWLNRGITECKVLEGPLESFFSSNQVPSDGLTLTYKHITLCIRKPPISRFPCRIV